MFDLANCASYEKNLYIGSSKSINTCDEVTRKWIISISQNRKSVDRQLHH